MIQKTKKEYEKFLNQMYADCYSEEQIVNALEYMTNKSRTTGTTTIKNIRSSHQNHIIGSLLRKYDPLAFEVGYNEWKS